MLPDYTETDTADDPTHGLLGLGADEVVLVLNLRAHGDHTDVHLDIHGNISEHGEQMRDWTFTPAASRSAVALAGQLVSLVLADNMVYSLLEQLAHEGVATTPAVGGGIVVEGMGDALEADDNVFAGVVMVNRDHVHVVEAGEASSCATDGEFGEF